MSAGQIVGGVVGGVLGSFVQNPWLGAQIGMGLGGYLDPPDGPTVEGPSLADLRYQSASYGVFLSRAYGTMAVSGNVFWLENDAYKHVTTKTKSGGKGGGSKQTNVAHSYYATFALSVDDARSKGAPLAGIRRIWLGGQLWYDAGSDDPDTIAASNAAASGFRFYPGSDTQQPDPRMQATLGVGSTSGWPGLAYIVFYDLPLESYQNTLAGVQAKVELMQSTVPAQWTATQYSLPASDTWACMAASPTTAVAMSNGAFGSNRVAVTQDGRTWAARTRRAGAGYDCMAWGGGVFITMQAGTGCDRSFDDGNTWLPQDSVPARDWVANPVNPYPPYSGSNYAGIAYGGGKFCAVASNISATTDDGGVNWRKGAMPSSGYGAVAHNGTIFCALKGGTNLCATSADGQTWTQRIMAAVGNWGSIAYGAGLFVAVGYSGGSPIQTSPDGVTWTERTAGGLNYKSVVWNRDHFVAIGYGSALASVSLDGITWFNIAMPSSQLWLSGCSFLGQVLVSAYTSAAAALINVRRIGAGALLSDVVAAECLQATSLTLADLDVGALTPVVSGYRVSRLGPIRSSLEVLRDAWPFDIRMNGYKIQFVMRGGASVATIPAADLDARVEGAEPGVQISLPREMDSQLPRVLWVNHIDGAREYEPGAQYAERLNSSAVNVEAIELPIVMTPTEAAGKAQVLLGVRWLERNDVVFNLPPTYRRLQPADVVSLTAPDGVLAVRLTRINNTSDGRVECAGKMANATVYTPTASGASGQSTGVATIPLAGPSVYQLLDIPLLHDVQAAAGFPVAMCGPSSGWRGGVLVQSADAGGTWSAIADFAPPGSTFGTATNAIGAAEARLLDTASRLTVVLTKGELFDCTELSMLGGANHFAYGADGRWEIIAAKTCALQSGSTYVLSGLLRGRYGTEQYMGSHVGGDVVVLLDIDELGIVSMASSTIGAARDYRGISVGADISSDVDRSFTYRAVNLTPLAPISLTGRRDPTSGDWTLLWVRRTRTGGEWRDYVDAELGETVEQYQIDICSDGTYAVVKRTLTVSAPAAEYLSADQVTDFGANQATLYLRICQMSASVGRGYPLTATITR